MLGELYRRVVGSGSLATILAAASSKASGGKILLPRVAGRLRQTNILRAGQNFDSVSPSQILCKSIYIQKSN